MSDAYSNQPIGGISRRDAIRYIASGVLTAAALTLPGCNARGNIHRIRLTDLLKKKYGREFEVVVGLEMVLPWQTRSEVYCCEKGVDDLVFKVHYDLNERSISRDEYVHRKLGRQVEDYIAKRCAEKDIRIASNGSVNIFRLDPQPGPDARIEELVSLYGDEVGLVSLTIVVSDSLESPRTSPLLAGAFRAACSDYHYRFGAHVYTVRDDEFDVYGDFLRYAPDFYSYGRPTWKALDCFVVHADEVSVDTHDAQLQDQYLE